MAAVVGLVAAFQVHAVLVIAGLNLPVPLSGPFHVHLPLFLAFGQPGYFIFQIQEVEIPFLVQPPFLHGFPDGAAGIRAVAAIREFALMGQLRQIRKAFPKGVFIRPHLDFPDAGIVNQQASVLEEHQLPRHGGVASLAGHLVHFPCPEPFIPQQGVDQRGFSHSGGTDDGDGLPLGKAFAEFLDSLVVQGADADDGAFRGQLPEGLHGFLHFLLGKKVRLVKQDEGGGAAAPDEGKPSGILYSWFCSRPA